MRSSTKIARFGQSSGMAIRWIILGLFSVCSIPLAVRAAGSSVAYGSINNFDAGDDGAPILIINDKTITEGNTSTLNAPFTVTLSVASLQTVTVKYATADGTATSGSDYSTTSGDLTFTPGQTRKIINVPVIGDRLDENNEDFKVVLSDAVGASIADAQGMGIITDNDAPPGVSIDDASIVEGDSGSKFLNFTVSLSEPSGLSVTVNYATVNLTAVADSDYVANSGVVTFGAGSKFMTVSITIKGDTQIEPDEQFRLKLSDPVNATIARARGTGTITTDDVLPTLSIGDASIVEGNDWPNTKEMTFTVTLVPASIHLITVNYYASGYGNCKEGTDSTWGDFAAAHGTLTFQTGQTSKTFTITVYNDNRNEADERFFVNLWNPINATIADGQGVGTILNNDPLPSLSINSVFTHENNSTPRLEFKVRLWPRSGQTVQVRYATSDGTARSPDDYTAASGRLTFYADTSMTTKTVNIIGNHDEYNEVNETLFVNLSNPINATIVDGQGVGTIYNDDVMPSLTIDDMSVTEGNSGTAMVNFTARLSAPSGQTVQVRYATSDGTARSPDDYTAASGTLTFQQGVTTLQISVAIIGDNAVEGDEMLSVLLTDATNATIADGQGICTILNDDVPG